MAPTQSPPSSSNYMIVSKKTLRAEYYAAVSTAISTAAGFLCALVWRDAVINILKRAEVWKETGADNARDSLAAIVVAMTVTFVAAGVIVLTSKWASSVHHS